jgi:hypothetical protein
MDYRTSLSPVTMTEMTDLSPQAQAILDAFNGYHETVNRRVKLAAALRVLADNVTSEKYISFTPGDAGFDKGRKQKNDCIREAILSIATELEVL